MNPVLQRTIFFIGGIGLVVVAALVPGMGPIAQATLFTLGGSLIGKEALPQSKAAP